MSTLFGGFLDEIAQEDSEAIPLPGDLPLDTTPKKL
jgi:hypothetical protein